MNKLALIAAFAFLALPVAAQASEHATPAAEETKAAHDAVEAKEVTLKDGTKVVIEGETVSVVDAEGKKTAAPDGEHELADGTKVTTKDGKLVTAPAAEAPAKH
ncbi:MAG: hypothetical protein A3J37_05115 [Alphaproteobacteria bacterium RIFCSPHIGHO2_12_FULL_45_9]|nr:MAG: hypothetical protein A3B66_04300 [Alphaproteobacteria bacterium RIFCSPHIGHO2_02_FULL_46_13]OFW99395.1 MAG: hypothetical protein A3J37_05115 [Alphaproteobacteria bacterium RIFCSPHIGHO2_12_FULL_45_9]